VGRTLATVGRGHEHREVEDPGHLLGDPVEVTALEHDLRQRGVQGVDPGQGGGSTVLAAAASQLLGPSGPIVGRTSHRQT
jgi:hypothetical protein